VKSKYVLLVLGVALVCVSGVAASSGGKDAKAPIHFELVSFAVPGSDLLTPFKAGAAAAANVLNKKGGLGGHKVIIDSCNSSFTPAGSTACAHLAVNNHAVATFGCELTWGVGGLPLTSLAKIPSVNCPDTSPDFNNPWTFGLNTSAIGQQRAAARLACTMKNVHKVIGVIPDVPQIRESMRLAYLILTACGKQTAPAVFYKLGAGDVQPYVAAAAAAKPDFVLFSGIDAQVALFFKAFQASGIPGSHVAMPDTDFDYNPVITAAGSSIEGAYAENQFKSWAQTSDPEVKAYIAAMKASGTSVDWRSANPEWAYVDVMFLASAAKAIGYDRFNGVTLQKFLSTKNGFPIPLGRALVNPGPKKFPQEKNPYTLFTQWKGGTMHVVPVGKKKDGWLYGY
jgi:branched-chain amino acid transport system substrate-binding protein